jgi:threonine dehydratase
MLRTVPNRNDIEQAHERIKNYIHETPVQTCTSINEEAGCEIFFKCENFQSVGAFKARGAMNAALSLRLHESINGIATHSSGNHAQAVARAAKILKIQSFIVMPRTAAEIKKNGVLAYGGEIFECEPTFAARERTLAAVLMKTGAVEIHPFNNYDVIAGQATAAKELFQSVPKLNVVIAPVGGGGLLSGTALAAKYFSPDTEVYAGEPEGADDAYRAMKSGNIEVSQANSIADGLLTSLGSKTFPIIRENVKGILPVSDKQIIEAMKLIWERMKIIVEPSCAVPLASILKSKEKFEGRRIGVILSGGNIDLSKALHLFSTPWN